MKNLLKLIITTSSLITLISCNSGKSNPSPPTVSSINIPLTYTVGGTSMDLHIPIKIGNNNLEVAVDTGSVGLRALKSQINDMSNIVVSNNITDYAYEDGVHIIGNIATAKIIFTGADAKGDTQSIAETIPFMLITSVDCVSSKPNCPKNEFTISGRGGVMGVRPELNSNGSTTSANNIWNPLSQFPENLGNGFIIDGNINNPNITIGLTPTNRIGFNLLNLASIPQPTPKAPYNLWDVTLSGSYAFNNDTPKKTALIFDTGTNKIEITDSTASNKPSGSLLNISVNGFSDGSFSWNTTTTNSGFFKTNIITNGNSKVSVNTGGAPFQLYNVLYDIQNGNIGFKKTAN